MNSNFFRHPALWATAAFLAGGLVFQAGRANAGAPVMTNPLPAVTGRQASVFSEGAAAPSAVAPSLKQLDSQFAELVEDVSRSVVHIRTEVGNSGMGQGSGVIIRQDGWIVTNDHVVNGATSVTVILPNGREYKGKVFESDDDRNDLAVIKIEAKDLPTAKLADSSAVRPGEYAIAVGAPFGLENTVTIGHISAVGRMNNASGAMGEVRNYFNMIQTDAPINPGNSGGPLLNIDGEVVGINTSIFSPSAGFGGGANAGIGFAIPSNQVSFVADLLMNNKKLTRGYLNVAMATLKPYELEEAKLSGGVRIEAVQPGGAAAKAGLQKSDIITKIGSYGIKDDQDLLNTMLRYAPGETVAVQVVRNGKLVTKEVKIDGKLIQQVASGQRRQNQPNQIPNLPELPDFNFEDWFNRDRNDGDAERMQPEESRKKGDPAKLGVQFTEVDASTRATFQLPDNQKGAVVVAVEPGSVAARLGLKPGDVVTKLGEKAIEKGSDLVEAVKGYKVGDSTMISFSRFDKNGTMQMAQTVTF
ncbi:MAG: trypsin-like peptidase domain-containing protein [Chthonomonas sp.]|nr:trypsin-like peptidase domain-containing protein [Chthonomonas sp.]